MLIGVELCDRFVKLPINRQPFGQRLGVALDHGKIIGDKRQRVVDLMRHPGSELSEAGEFFILNHRRLGEGKQMGLGA